MKLSLALFCSLLCALSAMSQHYTDSLWSPQIKTATLYRSAIDQEAPVLTLGSNDWLLLQFDLLADEPSLFRYTLRHCNALWQPDDLATYEYIMGMDNYPIDEYESSINTLTPYFHYHARIPAQGSQLMLSGNYILFVHPDDDLDSIVLSMRLQVSEELLNTSIQVSRPSNGIRIQQDQEVSVQIQAKRDLSFGEYMPFNLSPEYLMVKVQQNGRLDNQTTLPFANYCEGRLCYRWKNENIFAGGNSFRYFDLSNLNASMYNVQRVERYGGETFAIIRPEEDRSRQHYTTQTGLNGGMKINAFDRYNPTLEADYVWVNLSLPMQQPFLNGSIHVVGALTQWHLDDDSRMDYNPQYHAYTYRKLLKQGYYAYQLIFIPTGEQQALTATIEGDHIETPNDYHVYVYYHAPGDRYDRLLSVNSIVRTFPTIR